MNSSEIASLKMNMQAAKADVAANPEGSARRSSTVDLSAKTAEIERTIEEADSAVTDPNNPRNKINPTPTSQPTFAGSDTLIAQVNDAQQKQTALAATDDHSNCPWCTGAKAEQQQASAASIKKPDEEPIAGEF